ncbi:MAG: HYR domain-containing protein [Saprospiraceae bacterium]|nr:HYR domain-containing protein [Saprospiraceae bacterium]
MPKPIFALCLAFLASIATYGSYIHFNNYFRNSNELNSLIQNQNLAIICPPPVSVSVPSNVCSVFVNIPLPTSDNPSCPITFLSNNLTGTNNPSGMYSPQTFTLIWTIMDGCGMSMTCNQVISITDNTAPVLVCPQNIVVPCNINQALPYANINSFLAANGQSSDNCQLDSISFQLVSQTIIPQPIPLLVYSRVYRIKDIHTNEATCMQRITVADVIPPSIICPPDITTGNSDDGRNTMVIVDMPITSDNCGVQSVMNSYNNTNDASDDYPVGTTVITWTATDLSGNTATCNMSVIVFDNTPPDIFCPDEETFSCIEDLPLPYFNFPEFESAGGDASDETALDTLSFALLDEFSDNMTCPETISRIYVVSDEAGNSATCTQTFIIDDEIIPVIQNPAPIANRQCNDMLPMPQSLIATDNCGDVVAIPQVLPFTPNNCTGYTVTHRWTAMDDCGNLAIPVSMSFQVLPDIAGPVITPPQNITVNTENNVCQANVTVPLLVATDNCSSFAITNNRTNTPNASGIYPLGTTSVIWTVTDACNNSSSITQSITVIDNQGPNLNCKSNLIVALNQFPNNNVPASYFINSATDNCGGNVTIQARRMNQACGIPNSNTFSATVPFCCTDVPLTNLMVQIQATDARNRITTCMVSVDVQDNIAPVIVEELPDISISCAYPLDVNDLSDFGTYVSEGSVRQPINIQDHFYLPSGNAGLDGVYFDNCPDVTVSVNVINNLVMCNTGTIERVFTIQDAQGLNVTTTQTIYVIDINPFNETQDIDWPDQQVFFPNCNIQNPNPSITGRPVLGNDKCSQAAATYSDLTFPNNVYCNVIRRRWTVVDWCQYVPNTNIGRWTFDQYINVTNTVPPTINPAVCQTLNVCTDNGSCTGNLNIQASGTDDCLPVQISWTYKIDEGNNNSIDFTGSGATINRPISRGTHKITWEAKDKCGNVSKCDKLVHIKECKAPTGIVHHGLAINLTAPMAMSTINVLQFNNGSFDNCTPSGQLRFSFSANLNDVVKTYNCSHRGQQPIQIYVTDLDGNQSIVNTYIIVQDNSNLCNGVQRVVIAGVVKTVDQKELADSKIILEGGETLDDQMTNEEGKYCFQNLGMHNDYRLTAKRDKEPLKGISTLDLVLIQRHILKINPFISAEEFWAADVDGSKSINTIDLVTLRKLILGTLDTFPKNDPWVLVRQDQRYLDPANPWLENSEYMLSDLDSNSENIHFTGIKIGDVNHSYSTDLLDEKTNSRTKTNPEFWVEDVLLKKGEIYTIPVMAKNINGILSQQCTFELLGGLDYLGFESKELPLHNDQIAFIQKDGRKYITCAYHNIDPINVKDDEILFNIVIRSAYDQRISKMLFMNNDITESKVYYENLENKSLSLSFTSLKKPETSVVKQNHPNPFKEQTILEYHLAERGPVFISVYDPAGKQIFRTQTDGNMGINAFILGQKEIGETSGILYVKIKSGDLNEVIKMMRIE